MTVCGVREGLCSCGEVLRCPEVPVVGPCCGAAIVWNVAGRWLLVGAPVLASIVGNPPDLTVVLSCACRSHPSLFCKRFGVSPANPTDAWISSVLDESGPGPCSCGKNSWRRNKSSWPHLPAPDTTSGSGVVGVQ